jgi:hypothetical protein
LIGSIQRRTRGTYHPHRPLRVLLQDDPGGPTRSDLEHDDGAGRVS